MAAGKTTSSSSISSMSSSMSLLVTMLILMLRIITNPAEAKSANAAGNGEPCKPDKLTVYKVVLTTHWTRDAFPKQYPEFRPHAQWSKVVGRSHDESYILWRLGLDASNGLKIFAETGKSDVLDAQSQGEGGIYDEFSAPPINSGAGRTEAEFFVDGNHSRVSLISRIIPSPDWIIGVDGLDLCAQGSWVDSLTFEVDPVDVGTDNGFTFTAPNWATVPQERIYRISSIHPSHPANSFYYPHLKKLPPLATFRFLKVKEYELSQVFYHDDDGSVTTASENESENDVNNVLQHAIQHKPPQHHHHVAATTTTTTTRAPPTTAQSTKRPPSYVLAPRYHHAQTTKSTNEDIINKIIETYEQKRAKNNKKGTKRRRGPRHCHVSDWSDWTPCSKTCGIGESTRSRTILKHARRGGKACPSLLEKKWCGSARSCKGAMEHYFNW